MGNSEGTLNFKDRKYDDTVGFTINGKSYKVGSELDSDTTLNTFIREHAHLKGTKFMCLEGGCGSCIVNVEIPNPKTKQKQVYAANSCMVPVFGCQGWVITTIDGIGSKNKGYHPIQKRLAAANGTQCGYCSPGMVMNMYSIMKRTKKMTMAEIENSFGGNICRCTGYRPIMDAFKSFATDATRELKDKFMDIEDIDRCCGGDCEKCEVPCWEEGGEEEDPELLDYPNPVAITMKDGGQWFRPNTKKEIFEVIDMIGSKKYMLVAGHTGQGAYRMKSLPDVYIDIKAIGDLHGWTVNDKALTLGGTLSLTETMDIFTTVAKGRNNFAYCKTLADHIDMVANVPVRSMGTLAGNICLKHMHRDFPSDLFLLFETVGAKVVMESSSGVESSYSMVDFLQMDLKKKLITKFILPPLDKKNYIVATYKIMPRSQNAHAHVNVGFKFKINRKNKYPVLEKPSIVYGGINPKFVHATKTEAFLNGKSLLEQNTLDGALNMLSNEINPDKDPPAPSPEYRKGLALALFYKFVLSLNPQTLKPKFRSGGAMMERPLSSGKQDFNTKKDMWPLSKPMNKIEGLMQCAGEIQYTNDIPSFPEQLWSQFVLSDRAGAVISRIDASEALSMPGVVAFYSAKDVPNNRLPSDERLLPFSEKVFADTKTEHAGQALGVIVAETHSLAMRAAKKVKVIYGKSDPLMTDLKEVVKEKMTSRMKEMMSMEPTAKKSDTKFKVSGDYIVPTQYHFCMETVTCLSVPTEEGLNIFPTTQWPALVHEGVSTALKIPQNRINLQVSRLGGGYGTKITASVPVSVASSLAAVKLKRPVRLIVSLENNMEWAGKRVKVYANYEAGVDEKGVIQYLNLNVYEDDGFNPNDSPMFLIQHHLPNCYDASTWSVKGYGVKTDMASSTWCRAPGSTEATSIIDNIMEHIASTIKRDPLEVKMANMRPDTMCRGMVEDLMKSSDYEGRKKAIDIFNQENRWKKRGIAIATLEWPYRYFGNFYGAVTIFKSDASVAIRHSAIEMGQGCNTKAAQAAAYMLGTEVENVSVKPMDTNVFPNTFFTGASLGDTAFYAIKKACEELNQKLEPVKQKLGPNAKWADIIMAAYGDGIDLTAKYMVVGYKELKGYSIYGSAVTEVEMDILTGDMQTIRMDVIEDAGESMSPEIDIGQIEGSIAMGIGMYTSEEVIHNKSTGKVLTNRTWNYKPPGAKDIPVDLRVTLLKNSSTDTPIFRSKAIGEPPFCLSTSVVTAMRYALSSARRDANEPGDGWFTMELPMTKERVWMSTGNKIDQYKL